MAAGQPRADIATRARNWLWYWLVSHESQLSDDDLDRAFVQIRDSNAKRPRSFFRIRRLGSAPTDTRGYRKKVSIFATVHSEENRRAGLFEHARRAFESPLWELLSNRPISPARLEAIIEQVSVARGLVRIDPRELQDLNRIIQDPQVASAVGLGVGDSECLPYSFMPQDLDAVALLGALYRQALIAHNLHRAVRLQDAISDVAVCYFASCRPPEFLSSLILRLINDRLCGATWIDERTWAQATGRTLANMSKEGNESKRVREIHAYVNWYIGPRKEFAARDKRSLPRTLSPALRRARHNAEVLTAYRLAMSANESVAFARDDEFFEDGPEFAEELRQRSSSLALAMRNHLLAKFGDFEHIDIDFNAIKPMFQGPPPVPREEGPAKSVSDVLDRIDREDRERKARARQARLEAKRRFVPKNAE